MLPDHLIGWYLVFILWGTGIIYFLFPFLLWFYIASSCFILAICLSILWGVVLVLNILWRWFLQMCLTCPGGCKWKHPNVYGCIYGQTISREKANCRSGNCPQCSQMLWALYFFCKNFTVFGFFLKLLYKTLDIETLLSPVSCFWRLLFEELQGAP